MSTDARAIAIILARGGSKGVPGKNTAPIAGKPCIAWTIEHAQASQRVDRVCVSTDDERAMQIAIDMGCEVVHRPPELAGDRATIDDAARHALRQLVAPNADPGAPIPTSPTPRALGCAPDQPIVILYANVPVRPAGLIDSALSLLASTRCDSVQSYQPVGKHHPWWTARVDSGTGEVRPWEGAVLNHGVYRRQDLPPAFIPDGAIIALTRRALMLEVPSVAPGPHAFFGRDVRGVINPEGSVVDIDSPMDLLIADATLRQQRRGQD
jgi:N-acylneuraminate cytidylyltransferase